MAERRTLTEGLMATPAVAPEIARKFIYGDTKAAADAAPTASDTSRSAPPSVNRVPLSTRMRSDFAAALKRASLERQLAGTEPNTLQDILEQAMEPWLKSNGYIA